MDKEADLDTDSGAKTDRQTSYIRYRRRFAINNQALNKSQNNFKSGEIFCSAADRNI
jgi:hypothetical protein